MRNWLKSPGKTETQRLTGGANRIRRVIKQVLGVRADRANGREAQQNNQCEHYGVLDGRGPVIGFGESQNAANGALHGLARHMVKNAGTGM
jgi:hypothetical protein